MGGPTGHAPIDVPPWRSRRNGVSATHEGPAYLEAWTKDQTITAGKCSGHFDLFEAQRTQGWSPYFDSKCNALGNLSVRALKGMRYAWKRWREHTLECRIYWRTTSTEDPAHEAVYFPFAAQLANYFGHRSLKGKTAAAGAHTALVMCVKAIIWMAQRAEEACATVVKQSSTLWNTVITHSCAPLLQASG